VSTTQPPRRALLSRSAQERLIELQRSLLVNVRSLEASQSRFLGALDACDLATQHAMSDEYRELLKSTRQQLERMVAFLERYAQSDD
jgi:hypothetical protein